MHALTVEECHEVRGGVASASEGVATTQGVSVAVGLVLGGPVGAAIGGLVGVLIGLYLLS